MNNIHCKLSLGFPVYNGEEFIKESLDSILSQTFEHFELIISDNASTDATEAICREYAAQDSRIRYYRNEQNLGAAKNYNKVFELSQGTYFKWINHDDIHAQEFLEHCVQALDKQSSSVLAFPKSVLIDEQGKHIEELFYDLNINSSIPYERLKRYHECVWKPSIAGNKRKQLGVWMPIYGVVRRDALKKTRLIGSYVSSDTILLEELALLGKFCLVPEYLFFKREHDKRSTKANQNFKKRILWFDPSKKGKMICPKWTLLYEQFKAVQLTQTSMNYKDKLFCYYEVLRRFRLQWRVLIFELSTCLPDSINVIKQLPKNNFYTDK